MIYGIGETVLDIVFRDDQPQRAIPGGSTFNSMISLGRCGLDCAMLAQTGDDHVGALTMEYLRENGVSDRLMSRCTGMKSHLSLAFLNEQSDANYTFYKDHTGWQIEPLMAAVEQVQFTAQDALLFGSFFAVNPLVRPAVSQLLHKAHDAGAMIYYDLNYRRPHVNQLAEVMPNIVENIALSTVVRASAEDLEAVAHLRLSPRGEERIEEKIDIITDGAGPVRLYTKDGVLELETPKIEPISTVGAGDNFNAGFLYRYMQLGLKPQPDTWTEAEWLSMARTGQAFGQEVCMSWENSISKEYEDTFYDTRM